MTHIREDEDCKFLYNILYSVLAAFFCNSVTIILTFIIIIIIIIIIKGKCIYIALIFVVHARRSGMDHSFICNYTNAWLYTS